MAVRKIRALVAEAREDIRRVASRSDLEHVRVRYLGKKGRLTEILRSMPELPAEERPAVGREANAARHELESALVERLRAVEEAERRARLAADRPDLSLPGRRLVPGRLHPLTQVLDEIIDVFVGLGFAVAEGPEVETDYYNFEALNMPKDHPARDMQDTFYVEDDILLRTHTSPVQIRTMLRRAPPVRIICPGRVYRRDADITHSPMFTQVEGLAVDRDISMGALKGTLRWLSEFGDTEASPREIAERLTMAGIEVASVAPAAPDLAGVVVAEVTAVSPHPAGHGPTVCDVSTGTGRFRVVCEAPNVRAGVRAAFAPPGTVLPGGRRIGAAPVRGT